MAPVADLVERTLPLPGGLSVLLVLGTAEVMLGIFIISRVLLRLSLFVLAAHLIGTLIAGALVLLTHTQRRAAISLPVTASPTDLRTPANTRR